MRFTKSEMAHFASLYTQVSPFSCFKNLEDTELEVDQVLDQLEQKGALVSGTPVPGMQAVLDILAQPERCARLKLKNDDTLMLKEVFCVADQRMLVEYLDTEVMLSIYDSEADSVRHELSNQTGVAFQKHAHLAIDLDSHGLLAFAVAVDAHRQRKLQAHAGKNIDFSTLIPFETLTGFIAKPLYQGLLEQVYQLVGLHGASTHDSQALIEGLQALEHMNLVGLSAAGLELKSALLAFSNHFLLPKTTILLEVNEGSDLQHAVAAKEIIVMATPKDALSISTNDNAFSLTTLTASEVLATIDAYLRCPILSE